MNLNLKGKIVLVSGSSRGIGFGIAKSFAIEGATVIITGRDQKKLDDAIKEIDGINISSPGNTPASIRLKCRAEVPLTVATAYVEPVNSASSHG